MNAIAFGTKRTFHGFVRVTRRALASFGLTAARFDMVYAASRLGAGTVGRALQRDVRRSLGVSAPVVSRMLSSLEALGWVVRSRPTYGDRRQRWVRLTEKGEAGIRRASRVMLRGVNRIVFAGICFGKHRDPIRRLIRMSELEGYLRVLRKDFGDQATLPFPWGHPDE